MNTFQHDLFIYPRKTVYGSFLNRVLNNSFFIQIKRLLFYPVTQMQLTSDITNVVYLNWMVPATSIQHLVPKDVKLLSYSGNVMLTVLTYKHGNFRLAFFSRFKKIFASPVQSNWRFYIENTQDFGILQPAVFFIKNCIDGHAYALGSRIVSSILQTHLPHNFTHICDEKSIITEIQSGCGNAPDLYTEVRVADSWNIPAAFNAVSSDQNKLIEMICNQDAAVAAQPEAGVYAIGNIELKFQIEEIQPLKISVLESAWLKEIIQDAECFAFLMPNVTFITQKEKIRKIK